MSHKEHQDTLMIAIAMLASVAGLWIVVQNLL
jgi:phosphate starvation-inducible membrane PsiE